MAKDAEYRKMIHSVRWLRLRRDKLTDEPLCEDCKARGQVRLATEVHHVRPVEDGLTEGDRWRLMFDAHNLRALCHECHVRVHVELGRSGRKLAERRREEQLRLFRERFMEGEEAPGGVFQKGGGVR